MKIVCIGGGPAGLYLGILMKLASSRHQVTVVERNRPEDTFGFGVVFSAATLGNLAAADPASHAAITRSFAHWDELEVHVRGEVLRSTGHGFCGLERKQLLAILQGRAKELGVDVQFEHEVTSLEPLMASSDLVVGADGVASWTRSQLADHFQPSVDVRRNKFVWLGTTVPYAAFTFLFKETAHGLFRVHAYRYAADASTFIVECTPETWQSAGLVGGDEDHTIAVLQDLFADELGGHKLIKNRSIWRNFPTVRNQTWRHANVVLVGDAAHTAHFSIGSGTKLAMEDTIALRDALITEPDVEAALAAYEMKRRPEVESLQAAAQASLEWFEGTERYLSLSPVQFTYSLATRSLRVSHASVERRDPPLARAVEQLLARTAGLDAVPPPMFVPATIGGLTIPNRVALAPWTLGAAVDGVVGDPHLVFLGARAAGGAGLVMTETIDVDPRGGGSPVGTPRLGDDEQTVAWRRVVDYIHAESPARVGAQLAAFDDVTAAQLGDAAQRAGFAGFDLLVLHLGVGQLARWLAAGDVTELGAAVAAVRAAWPADRVLGVRVVDDPPRRDAIVAAVAGLRGRGVTLVWVAADVEAVAAGKGRRISVAPLADRLRNELGVATVIEGVAALPADLDALIAAGRCDLCALDRALVVDPGFVQRAGEAVGWPPPPPDPPELEADDEDPLPDVVAS